MGSELEPLTLVTDPPQGPCRLESQRENEAHSRPRLPFLLLFLPQAAPVLHGSPAAQPQDFVAQDTREKWGWFLSVVGACAAEPPQEGFEGQAVGGSDEGPGGAAGAGVRLQKAGVRPSRARVVGLPFPAELSLFLWESGLCTAALPPQGSWEQVLQDPRPRPWPRTPREGLALVTPLGKSPGSRPSEQRPR